MDSINKVAEIIIQSKRTFAFTGAGISVESGIPTFRGEEGIWNQFDTKILDLQYYLNNSNNAWPYIKELFYSEPKQILPNMAHQILANWEERDLLTGIITQNIDYLHQKAGSNIVHELHGTTNSFLCTSCKTLHHTKELDLTDNPPKCLYKKCSSLLKPNFIFFGEDIPHLAYSKSQESTLDTDVYIIIGTSGEVSPANQIPIMAKQNGAILIEINIMPSLYTNEITDIFLQGKSTEILHQIDNKIKSFLTK